jgi:hypothetical protein
MWKLSLFNYRFPVEIIAFQRVTVLYIINRKIHGCLKIPDIFLVLNMISHSFAALTREISCSTLELNLVFPRTHACIILYIILLFNRPFLTMSLDTTACFFKVRSFKDRNLTSKSRLFLPIFKDFFVHQFGGELTFWTTKTINYDADFLWKMVECWAELLRLCLTVAKVCKDLWEQTSIGTFQL